MKRIYLDYAATTPVAPEVLEAMGCNFTQNFGNPSSLHFFGQEARKAVDEAREKVSRFLNCQPGEIIFTSCATESINLALKGLVEALSKVSKQPHVITSPIEHHAGLDAVKHLEKQGVQVTYLPVDRYGLVNPEDVEKAIKENTVLVSVMYVNNEVGTIEPIEEIGKIIQTANGQRLIAGKPNVFLHTDATQAIQYLECDVGKLGVDLLSFTGHKFYAPKGVGALYARKGTPLVRQQDGGLQEYGLRAGTENVPYIVGLGKAIESISNLKSQISNLKELRDYLIDGILSKITKTHLTGHPKLRVPHIVSFVIEGAEGEAMLLHLDQAGIAASSGSACTSGILEPSHVLKAMGYSDEQAHGSLRFSLGRETKKEDLGYVLKVLPDIVGKLRQMSPL